jgi:hypothetical protein
MKRRARAQRFRSNNKPTIPNKKKLYVWQETRFIKLFDIHRTVRTQTTVCIRIRLMKCMLSSIPFSRRLVSFMCGISRFRSTRHSHPSPTLAHKIDREREELLLLLLLMLNVATELIYKRQRRSLSVRDRVSFVRSRVYAWHHAKNLGSLSAHFQFCVTIPTATTFSISSSSSSRKRKEDKKITEWIKEKSHFEFVTHSVHERERVDAMVYGCV